jgi:hypothetical protein
VHLLVNVDVGLKPLRLCYNLLDQLSDEYEDLISVHRLWTTATFGLFHQKEVMIQQDFLVQVLKHTKNRLVLRFGEQPAQGLWNSLVVLLRIVR